MHAESVPETLEVRLGQPLTLVQTDCMPGFGLLSVTSVMIVAPQPHNTHSMPYLAAQQGSNLAIISDC